MTDDRPVFYYDLCSPDAWLAAERIHDVLAVAPVWQPVLLDGLRERTGEAGWAAGPERAERMAEVERRAAEYGLMDVRWPAQWPTSTLLAMRAAIFAQQAGRAVAFSLAAFRQAFCAGRDLADPDYVMIAAAACELHPKALAKGVESRSVKDRLRAETAAAADRGVVGVPAVAVGDQLFHGDDQIHLAAAAAGA
jgi:2-hydroxychromene-2-carboxylate isomerase